MLSGNQEAGRDNDAVPQPCLGASLVILQAAKASRAGRQVLEAEALHVCRLRVEELEAQEAEESLPSGKETILALRKLPDQEQDAN